MLHLLKGLSVIEYDCALRLDLGTGEVVIGVYLPCLDLGIDYYRECLAELEVTTLRTLLIAATNFSVLVAYCIWLVLILAIFE